MSMNDIEALFANADTGFVIGSAVRYNLGRMSVGPGLVQDWIKRHWSWILFETRKMIVRDVKEAIEDHEAGRISIGMDVDYQMWKAFLLWMLEHENE